VDQGTRAITAQAASRGLLDSGATGKALVRFGQQEASQEFGNWYNRLAGVVGLGQTATAQSNNLLMAGANAAQNFGQTIGDLTVGNTRNNGLITLNQGQIAGQGAAANGQLNSGLISNLGGIGVGLLNNWPSGGGANLPGSTAGHQAGHVGVPPAGLINSTRDWRMGPPP
jgi:hypothetical protein